MNKVIIGVVVGLSIAVLFAFNNGNYQPSSETAEVNQMQGLFIYSDSKPVLEYEYLGTVKLSVTWSGQYQTVRNKLIRRAKKDYPDADGLILQFKDGGTDRCDAIKFK